MSIPSLVVISNLYPNALETTKGLFIKQLTDSFAKKTKITVIAPVPFNPKEFFGLIRSLPKHEIIDGVEVFHPRYIVIPKLFRSLTGIFFYWGIRSRIKQLISQGKAAALSVHWVYPDGFGAVLAAKKFNLPIAVHALGCDINEYTKFKIRRKLITYTLQQSSINFVKSQELKDKITALGVDDCKTNVVLNGVDKNKFFPIAMQTARTTLQLAEQQKYLLFVGNFQIEKGLDILIESLSTIRELDWHLLVIGGGPMEANINQKIQQLELQQRITLLGRVEHQHIPNYLAAADLLCLPSLREGCPNVVLEALSCGTPVVASRVGAVPDIITQAEFGVIVEPQDRQALAQGISQGLTLNKSTMPAFDWYDWDENAQLILDKIAAVSLN